MKNVLLLIAAAALIACGFSACKNKFPEKPAATDSAISIVTTIFPEYDWVMNILGDNPAGAGVTMLLDSKTDLHSYQPSAEDILKISKCDLFIYVGGESDEWAEDALKEAENKNMKVIRLMDVLGSSAKEEEVVEGMQEEEDHHHGEEGHEEEDHHHGEEGHEEEEAEYDEHVWLSLRNAERFISSISEAVSETDPVNAGTYKTNADNYIKQLASLDSEYKKAVESAPVKTLLFGDRFPFRYMTDDYGLSYYAAFVGCSAETEASFETISFLAKKVDELSLHAVMTIEGGDHRIAETIVRNTQTKDQKILTLDSMQSASSKDVRNGKTYLAVMKQNLSVLKDALK